MPNWLEMMSLACCAFAICSFTSLDNAIADVKNTPNKQLNIFHNYDSQFEKTLKNNGYTPCYKYDFKKILTNSPRFEQRLCDLATVSPTAGKVCTTPEQHQNLATNILNTLVYLSTINWNSRWNIWESRENYLSRSAKMNKNSKVNAEFFQQYKDGRIELSKKIPCTLADRNGRQIKLSQHNLSLLDLPIDTLYTPVSLLNKSDKIYTAFLDYKIVETSVDEEIYSGKFANGAKNIEIVWNKLYMLNIDDIINL